MSYGNEGYIYHGPEQRKFPRYRLADELACYLIQMEEISGRAVDISAGGLCVATPESFEDDSYLLVHVTLPGDSQEIEARGRVVWCKRRESLPNSMGYDLRYRVGIEFTEIDETSRQRISKFVSAHLIQD